MKWLSSISTRDSEDEQAITDLVLESNPLKVEKVYEVLSPKMGSQRVEWALFRLVASGKVTYNEMWELVIR